MNSIERRISRLEEKILAKESNNIDAYSCLNGEHGEELYEYFKDEIINGHNIKFAEYLGTIMFRKESSNSIQSKYTVRCSNVFNNGTGTPRIFGNIWIDIEGRVIKDTIDIRSVQWGAKNIRSHYKRNNYYAPLNMDLIR